MYGQHVATGVFLAASNRAVQLNCPGLHGTLSAHPAGLRRRVKCAVVKIPAVAPTPPGLSTPPGMRTTASSAPARDWLP